MRRHFLSIAVLVLLPTAFMGCSNDCEETRAGENPRLRIQSKLGDSLRPSLNVSLFTDFGQDVRVFLPQNWRDTTIPIPLEMADYPLRVSVRYRLKAILDSIVISSDSSYSILWIDTLKPKEKADTLSINGKRYTMKYESHLTHCF